MSCRVGSCHFWHFLGPDENPVPCLVLWRNCVRTCPNTLGHGTGIAFSNRSADALPVGTVFGTVSVTCQIYVWITRETRKSDTLRTRVLHVSGHCSNGTLGLFVKKLVKLHETKIGPKKSTVQ